jgi:CubicO group peptidase (beta-lactamase class C family)
MAEVHGHCDEVYAEVKELLKQNIHSGKELGASITINVEGNELVNIWGGYKDHEHQSPWNEDTITNIFSSTKTIAAFAILKLHDEGRLNVDDKVAKHWPEFAANGKQDIEVRHIMSHTSGLPGFDKPVSLDDICDAPKMARLLAEQAPWWTPGTASGYQSFTMGYLLGEIVLRVTGKTLKQYLAEDIAIPLKADFQLGCADEDQGRRSNVIPPPPMEMPSMDPNSVVARVMGNPVMDVNFVNTEKFCKAEIGAGNGHSNATGLNRILRVLAADGKDDKGNKVISKDTIDRIFEEQSRGDDKVLPTMGKPIRWGIGYALTGKGTWLDFLPEGKVAVWGGYGGSLCVVDIGRKVTFTYVMNKMQNAGLGDERGKAYIAAAYKALGVDI